MKKNIKQILEYINPIYILKKYGLNIVAFILVYGGVCVWCSLSIKDAINESKSKLLNDISFPGEWGVDKVCSGNGRTITQFAQTEMPHNNDESANNQMYGGYEAYFKVNGTNCWSIKMIKKVSDNNYEEYRIRPKAAATKSQTGDPSSFFSETYDNICKDKDMNCSDNFNFFIDNFGSSKSNYHYINRIPSEYGSESGSIWWQSNWESRVFYEYDAICRFSIVENKDAIILLYALCYGISFIFVVVLFILIFRLKKHFKRAPSIKKVPFIPASTKREAEITQEMLENLLSKLHPSNFMAPYDARKVRIANDLYEALQLNKDNKTMIEIIKEKAEKDLGISIDGNNDNLLI